MKHVFSEDRGTRGRTMQKHELTKGTARPKSDPTVSLWLCLNIDYGVDVLCARPYTKAPLATLTRECLFISSPSTLVSGPCCEVRSRLSSTYGAPIATEAVSLCVVRHRT